MTGRELRVLREEMGWTQYFLADVLGVLRSQVAHWEHDRCRVPAKLAAAMLRAHAKVTAAHDMLRRSIDM